MVADLVSLCWQVTLDSRSRFTPMRAHSWILKQPNAYRPRPALALWVEWPKLGRLEPGRTQSSNTLPLDVGVLQTAAST